MNRREREREIERERERERESKRDGERWELRHLDVVLDNGSPMVAKRQRMLRTTATSSVFFGEIQTGPGEAETIRGRPRWKPWTELAVGLGGLQPPLPLLRQWSF